LQKRAYPFRNGRQEVFSSNPIVSRPWPNALGPRYRILLDYNTILKKINQHHAADFLLFAAIPLTSGLNAAKKTSLV